MFHEKQPPFGTRCFHPHPALSLKGEGIFCQALTSKNGIFRQIDSTKNPAWPSGVFGQIERSPYFVLNLWMVVCVYFSFGRSTVLGNCGWLMESG